MMVTQSSKIPYPSRSEYAVAVSRILKRTFPALIEALFARTYCVGMAYDRRILGLNSQICRWKRGRSETEKTEELVSDWTTYEKTGPLFLVIKDDETIGRMSMDELVHIFGDECRQR